jgi:hypothetical protein
MHRYVSISVPSQSREELTGRSIPYRGVSRVVCPDGVSDLPFLFTYCICSFVPSENNASCSAIGQQAGIDQSSILAMNPGINCTFLEGVSYSAQFQDQRADEVVSHRRYR